jgi:DNA (cytosine-5)-methyltransferase 1
MVEEYMRSIELFTGAGGLALGTHRAGFHHLAVIERDHDSCATLQLNRVRRSETGIDWLIHEADVTTFDYSDYHEPIDLLAGGPPCQPFSLGGKHAGDTDRRNMFPAVFRAVRELRPRAFLFENVKGLTRQSFRPYFDYIIDQLAFPFVLPVPVRVGKNTKRVSRNTAPRAKRLAAILGISPMNAATT